jgi:hypothetical protein
MTAGPNGERRRGERRAFTDYVQFRDIQTGALVGTLSDISLRGFRLEGPDPVTPNMYHQFRIDLPPGLPGSMFIALTARSRWSQRHPMDSRLFLSGYEIQRMDSSAGSAIRHLFERYGAVETADDPGQEYMWQD